MKKKALFVDRDGTIIVEPPVDFQVDSLAKLEFVPGAISALKMLCGLDYDLVMATNQDGLGTDSFPMADFLPPHQKMLTTLAGEGVTFDDQLIDDTFEADNAPTRKPRTGMFGKYLDGEYDMEQSYVIGDRLTDILLARNLGAKGILIAADPIAATEMIAQNGLNDTCVLVTDSWARVAEFIRLGSRQVEVHRTTNETDISLVIDLDGKPGVKSEISTGLNFFDHMLDQIPHHGGVYMRLKAVGDLHVDEHHTIEDVAIVIGEAIDRALGSKIGIGRYGFALPMDDCRAMVLIDFGGRIDLDWQVNFSREYVGDVPTEMFRHFFKSLCSAAKCNLHISASGDNEHHKAEAIFKAFARALRMAVARNAFSYEIPSSKGLL